MEKYRLLRELVAAQGIVATPDLMSAEPAADGEILRAHEPLYLRRLERGELDRQAIRRLGFPWSPRLLERSRRSVGATLGACRSALLEGVGVNLAGGTHHAFADRGEGFCVLNDAAVALRSLQAEGAVRNAVVVDCDVHQGNGTAAIFAGDPSVFTLSLHGRRNFPFHKERSDLDVALEDGTTDDEYLTRLEEALDEALCRAQPDLVIYLAGADPYEGDRLGRLSLTRAGLAERDARVFAWCRAAGLPVAVAMAGGYATEVQETVAIHAETVRQAARLA